MRGVNVDGYIPKFNNKELEVETSVEAIINVNDYDYNLRKISSLRIIPKLFEYPLYINKYGSSRRGSVVNESN